jgi:hypothetical protein
LQLEFMEKPGKNVESGRNNSAQAALTAHFRAGRESILRCEAGFGYRIRQDREQFFLAMGSRHAWAGRLKARRKAG